VTSFDADDRIVLGFTILDSNNAYTVGGTPHVELWAAWPVGMGPVLAKLELRSSQGMG